MVKKNVTKYIFHFAFITILCVFFSTTIFASTNAESNKVIKVALPKQYGFAETDSNGNPSGYTYEVLMKIAQRTGWEFEFVTYEFSNEQIMQSLNDLKEGTVDLAGAMTYNDTLAEMFAFSSIPYGYGEFVLFTEKTNNNLNFRSLYDYPNLRIALVEGATNQNQLIIDYCESKGINYTITYVNSSDESRILLGEDKADAFVSKNIVSSDDYKALAYLGKQSFYFAANKNKPEIAKEIDRALDEINTIHPYYLTELYQEYFVEDNERNLALTTDEKMFLKEKPILKVTVLENLEPWQYIENGEYKGIVVDLLKEISKISGIEVEFVSVKNLAEARARIKSGEADIIPSLPAYFPLCDEYEVSITSPFLSVPVVYVSNNLKAKQNKKILVSSEINIIDQTSGFEPMEDVSKIVSLVNSGAYTGAYIDGFTAQHAIASKVYTNVKLATLPYSNYSTAIAVSKKCDGRVIRILEQSLASIPKSRIAAIVYDNTTYTHTLSFIDIIKQNPIEAIAVIVIVSFLIIIMFIIMVAKGRKLNKIVSLEKNQYKHISQTDRLTHTYNNTAFKIMATAFLEKGSIDTCGTLMVCDIDNFKTINDGYGHLKGDEVLTKVGAIMLEVFKGTDIVGRLGGDEMVVLLTNVTDKNIVSMRCEELLLNCAKISNEFVVTLSIGAAIFQHETAFVDLFEKADGAMYRIKNNSKNGYEVVEMDV